MPDHHSPILADLRKHPGWKVLRAEYEAAKEEYYAKLARRLMHGHDDTSPSMEHRRFYFKGMEFLLDAPDVAASAIEKAIAKEVNGDF